MRHFAGNRCFLSCLLLGWGCTVVVGADVECTMSKSTVCSTGGVSTTRIVLNSLPMQYLFFYCMCAPRQGVLPRHNASLGGEHVRLYLVVTSKTRAERIHRLFCFLFTLRAHIFALLFKGTPIALSGKNISQHFRYVHHRHEM